MAIVACMPLRCRLRTGSLECLNVAMLLFALRSPNAAKPKRNRAALRSSMTLSRGLQLQPPINEPSKQLSALLRQVAARDREAFALLYSATSSKLYGIILRILKRREIADEILQEVYLKIWQNAADFDTVRGSAITWMASIARNRAIDEVRRSQHLQQVDTPEALEVASSDPDALSILASKQDLHRLLACMEKLEQGRRDMVLLAYFHGLSRDALATRFGHPVATIKTWLHRSLAQLKDCVGQ